MMRKTRRTWPKGTYMKVSKDRLRVYLLDQDDMKNIYAGREDKVDAGKMSQRLLAEKAGVDPSFINHLTSGRRNSCTPERAERIAEALGVPVRALFDVLMTNATSQTARRRTTITKVAP